MSSYLSYFLVFNVLAATSGEFQDGRVKIADKPTSSELQAVSAISVIGDEKYENKTYPMDSCLNTLENTGIHRGIFENNKPFFKYKDPNCFKILVKGGDEYYCITSENDKDVIVERMSIDSCDKTDLLKTDKDENVSSKNSFYIYSRDQIMSNTYTKRVFICKEKITKMVKIGTFMSTNRHICCVDIILKLGEIGEDNRFGATYFVCSLLDHQIYNITGNNVSITFKSRSDNDVYIPGRDDTDYWMLGSRIVLMITVCLIVILYVAKEIKKKAFYMKELQVQQQLSNDNFALWQQYIIVENNDLPIIYVNVEEDFGMEYHYHARGRDCAPNRFIGRV